MKVLVTGSGGMLGNACVRSLPSLGHTVVGLTHRDLDVTDERAVRAAVELHVPDAVLHCAARAHVDGCSREPDAAYRVNRDAAGMVARASAAVGAVMVYFSTDYVFDGRASEPYAPDHVRNPLSVYARSKAEGEDVVLDTPGRRIVVRISWLFGGPQGGFPRFVLDGARAGRTLCLVEDQRSRPSWSGNVVRNAMALVQRSAEGIWHVTDGGDTTRIEQAREILRIAGLEASLEPVGREAFWPDVPRPAYSVLDITATETLLGRSMMPWPEATRRWMKQESIQPA